MYVCVCKYVEVELFIALLSFSLPPHTYLYIYIYSSIVYSQHPYVTMNIIKTIFQKSKKSPVIKDPKLPDKADQDNKMNHLSVNSDFCRDNNGILNPSENDANDTRSVDSLNDDGISSLDSTSINNLDNSNKTPKETDGNDNHLNSFVSNSSFSEDLSSSDMNSSEDSLSYNNNNYNYNYNYNQNNQKNNSIENLYSNTSFREQGELKNYKLLSKIGEGAFSKVYKAVPLIHNNDNPHYSEVAIKIIKKENLTPLTHIVSNNNNNNSNNNRNAENLKDTEKASSMEQVLKEVRLHKIISSNCSNVVQFVDFIETRSYYYLVQELLSGGEIFNAIVKFTYFSEDLSRHVIKQLGLAIKSLHAMGIVHRDIKPENLLYEPIEYIPNTNVKLRKSDDPDTKLDEGIFRPNTGGGGIGVVKLTDFGLSKQIYRTNTKTPCGTVGYTAPEVVKDERYSVMVDMWGIGCVLYTMLCGFPPFFDDKVDILTEKISRGEYTFLRPWWDEISDGAKNCVSKLLEVDPNKRYTIDEFLADPWLNRFDTETVFENNDERTSNTLDGHENRFKRKMISKYNSEDASLLFSPVAVAMRDAFDISNAVKRNEVNGNANNNNNNNKQDLFALDEINEEEPDIDDTSNFTRKLNQNQLDEKLFQLSLDSSTIIKRREKKQKRLVSPLGQTTIISRELPV